MCKKKETNIGKIDGDNIVGFKSRMNQHISDSRTEVLVEEFMKFIMIGEVLINQTKQTTCISFLRTIITNY